MTYIKNIVFVLALILVLDFMCFAVWIASGQKPVDNFYAGTISAHIIGAVVNK